MTSITAGRLHKPALLFDQSRRRLGSAGRLSVVGGAAQHLDRTVRIERAKFVAADALEVRSSELPRLDPALAERDLLRCSVSEGRGFIAHNERIIEEAL